MPSSASNSTVTASRRIVVGLSGGVDSAVAAALLLEQGWQVIGATLRLQPCQEDTAERRSCCGLDGIAEARAVAGQLGIPHYVVDAQESFSRTVLEPCWNDYAVARTPNPCVLCNRQIKFGLLLDFARSLGADRVATGHYAQLKPDAQGRIRLYRGADPAKDQSYFLAAMTREQLAAAVMPLGGMLKEEVRRLARERGFVNASRRESQDVCFAVPEGGFPEYLRRLFQAEARPGRIVDADGRDLGPHDGLHRFTVGQRQGLGIALGRPAWVKSIRATDAAVVLTTEPQDLETHQLLADACEWHGEQPPTGKGIACQAQIRYRQPPPPAKVWPAPDGRALIQFAQPVRAATPGQAVVFYQDDLVLGHGWIAGESLP